MNPSDNIRTFIMDKESFRNSAYKPINGDRWTYGYGATFKLDGSPVAKGDSISQKDAESLFNTVLDNLAGKLSRITSPLATQQQFDAVLSLCYNVGLMAFTNSVSGTMYTNNKDISNRFVLWSESLGKIIPGLKKRRLQERAIYVDNNYTFEPETSSYL